MAEQGNIIWLASYPKSGSTWFRVILHHLISGSEAPVDINELDRNGIASSRSLFDQVSGVSASDLSHEEIGLLQPEVYRTVSRMSQEKVFMKVHDAWDLNKAGQPLFPTRATHRVIYLVRHPLDVAVSLSFHNGESVPDTLAKMDRSDYGLCLGPRRLFNQLPQHLLSWSGHVDSWVRRSGLPLQVVRYEDLHLDPVKTLTEAMEFLGMPQPVAAIKKAVKLSRIEKLQEQEQKAGFQEKPMRAERFFRKGVVGDWKNHISEPEALAFLRSNKDVFNLFYDLD